jgi:hypothetical protein
LLEQTGGVQTRFRGQISLKKNGKPRARANMRGSDAVLGSDLGQKMGHINSLEQTGGVQTQFLGHISG